MYSTSPYKAEAGRLLPPTPAWIEKILIPVLQGAFHSPTSNQYLGKLQIKYGFKKSNTTIYKELRALFRDRNRCISDGLRA